MSVSLCFFLMLREYQCVEVSPDVVGDAAAQVPDAAEAPNVVTLLLPPLNLLATMQNSSEEEGNTNTRPKGTYHFADHVPLGTPFDGSGKQHQHSQHEGQPAAQIAAHSCQGSRPNFHPRGRHAGQ